MKGWVAMRSNFIRLAVVLLVVAASGESAWADGGTVRLVEEVGDYRISVFTSPNPLRAGPVDVSVLVQDAETAEPIAGAHVFVRLASRDQREVVLHAVATSAAATNKLLQAALVKLPTPGSWDVEVDCTCNASSHVVRFTMKVGPPVPRWFAVWPWFTWPLGAVLVFGVHRHLVARKQLVG